MHYCYETWVVHKREHVNKSCKRDAHNVRGSFLASKLKLDSILTIKTTRINFKQIHVYWRLYSLHQNNTSESFSIGKYTYPTTAQW